MTEPVITNGKIVGVNDTVTMSDAPEMLDARLYVFSEHNYVREEDYRAMMQLAKGFKLERNIMQEMAKDAKGKVDRLQAVNRTLARIRNDQINEAREAGRREGLEEAGKPLTAIEKPYYVKKDQEQAVFWLDAFIEAVNADHDDLILVPRDHGCLMRDEIERLRRVERAALSEAEGERLRAIEDLAMLVRRMVVRLRQHEDIPGDQKLADQAMDYLRRTGLASGTSILRNDPTPPKEKP